MKNSQQSVLPKGYVISEKYSVILFIKHGSNAETYRIKGKDGVIYFLKLFKYANLIHSAFDDNNNLLEIKFLQSFEHENIVSYHDSGELVYEGKKYGFLVLDFIAGETLAERICRESYSTIYDIKQIAIDILKGLDYIHSRPDPVIHNEITPQNIMLDLSSNVPKAILMDFGYARSFHQSTKVYSKDGLNLNYIASECFNNLFSPQSDLYSVGTVIYQLIYGLPPWFKDISSFQTDRRKSDELILQERNKPLSFPNISERVFDFDASIISVLKRALQQDPDRRFENSNEFIMALKGEIELEDIDLLQKVKSAEKSDRNALNKKGQINGFDAIAGMDELKEQMRLDVIDALHNPEEYAKYGITIPNGILLYGPPGCGKTFFAKHFAEEVGFNFMMITPSTLKSKYVNATQENIAKMFEDAEKNAPTIIFIDEINELLPKRDSDAHEMSKSAVNEMLAQMDRTGEKGIFIIGATNYPNMIDPAMLRAGRLDKKFYLPPPDFEARKTMFEMYLKTRPIDFGMNYKVLAELTENYVSADIEFLVNEASRKALKLKSRISMSILKEVIAKTKPSVSIREIQKYKMIVSEMKSENTDEKKERPRIGFKP